MNRRVLVSVAAVFFLLLSPLTPALAFGSGNCLDFDGSDDYAEGSGLSTSMTSITLEAWVCHRTLPSSVERYITVQGNLAVLRHDGWSQQGQLHFYIKTDGVQRDIRVNGALQDDRWYHVAGTWDGTDMKLYLNGEEVGTLAPGGSLDAPSGDVRLSSSAEPMDGYMDEVRIWSVARSADEIRGNMYKTLSGSETDLESYWKSDETSGSIAYDSAGSVDLTLYNMNDGDWVTSGAFSGPRNALDFDGTDDYVSIPSSPTLDNNQFSTEFWVKMDDPGGWDGIIDKGRSTNSDWYFLTRTSALGEGVVFSIRTASSLATLPYSWSDASWHHVAGTYDGTNMILYVDGVQRGSCTASMIVTTNNIRIGSRRNGTYHFEGKLDEVHIWDDVRTASEIQEHMCKTMEGDESNLVAYWRFDQAVGTTLYDLTSNDNDGALTNMTDDDWVTCNAFNTWIGCDGNTWGGAGRNWSLGIVPNSTSVNVGIPYYADGGNTIYINDADYNCNHLAISSGATLDILSGRTLKVNGNAFCSSSQTGDGELEFSGASASHGLSGTFSNVELNEASGAELAGDATINGALMLTSGTFTVGAHTLTIKNPIGGTDTNLSAGSNSSITVAGSAGGVNIPSSVTVLNNYALSNSNGTTLQNNLQLDGTLSLTNGALSIGANTLTIGGQISTTSGSLNGGSTSDMIFIGSGTGTNLPAVSLNHLTINRGNGIGLDGDVTVDGTLTLTDGAFTVGANTLTLKNAIAGTATNLSAGNTSSITIAGSGTDVNIPSSVIELSNLSLNNTNGTALQNDLELDGTLTLTDGAFMVGANMLTLKNAIAGSATNLSAGNTSSITIAGSGTSVNIPSSVTELSNLSLDNANGTILQSDLELDGPLTLTDGTLFIAANMLTLNGLISVDSGGLTGGSSSNIVFGGAGASTDLPAVSLNDLYINRSNGIGLAGDVTIDGTLTLTSGTFTVGANTLTLKNAIAGTSTNLSAGSTSSITIAGSGTGVNIPSSVTELSNLSLDNANGTALQSDLELDGMLTLTDGAFTLNGHTLSYGSSGTLKYNGASSQTASDAEFPSSNGPYNLTIDNSNDVNLAFDRTINGTITLSDGDLNLDGHTLTLGASATLSESEGNTIKGTSGVITTTRTFNAGDLSTGVNIAGMGAEITTDANLGSTVITRGHAIQTDAGEESILRYHDINPTNNSGLDAGFVFHYDDSERNGLNEAGLELYRSTDLGGTWSREGGTVDIDHETITLSGLDAFSRWTAFDSSISFTNAVSLTGVYSCSVAWGDYDNDGDLDVLLAGHTGSSPITRIYRNGGSDTFTDIGAGLTGVYDCSVAWGDYDNDGDLDVLLAGDTGSGSITRIYRNEGSDIFTDIGAGLTGVRNCSVAWGDYDNDGDLDALLAGDTGSGSITRIYRNEGAGTFTDIGAGLPGLYSCSVAWGDYDNDGDLDALLAGCTGGASSITRIYRNEGSDIFTDIGAGLTGVRNCSVAWGDYDNDGDLDVLLAGSSSSGSITRIYRNEGSDIFTDIGAGLTGVRNCSVAWGDYDNDGDLDALLAGDTGSGYISRIYRNEGAGTFTDIGAGLPGLYGCGVAWGDYDNDGDLDVLLAGSTGSSLITRIYRNDNPLGNTVPNAPTNLTATGSGQDVALSWDKATDVETDQNALTYNLRIGTTSGGIQIESPMANVGTGWRRVPALGKTNHNNSWTIKGLNNTTTYYWSVQAIDNAFAGSGFATEGSFTMDFPVATTAAITDITKTTATCGGEVTHEGGSSVTAKGIVWDTSEDPTIGWNLGMTNDGSGMGSFVSYLTGLAPSETYYVRAYATNAEQTVYGVEKVFATNMIPPGNGLDFDGSNDYVDVAQTSGLPIYNNGTGDAYTVSMWIKGGVQDNKRVFAEGRSTTDTPLFTFGCGAGGSDGVKLFIRDDGNTTLLNATSTYAAFDGTWHHIAWVDSSGTATLYVDGKPDATDFSYTRDTLTLNRTSIGAIVRVSASNHFTGEIDEVCLWNVARSETDIRNDMNRVLNGDEAGLVAYYRFDHLSGTALADRTTNDNDGTLMNMDDADWATSTASVGHESHIGTGTGNLSENVDVPVDITWDGDDPGTDAVFAAIQVDDVPDVVTGLPAYYDSTYWELWIAHDDGSFQADAVFHYDNLSGISDEATLALYTRTAPGQSWSLIGGTTIDYEGNTSDGVGSITANDLTAFSQFIVAGGQEMTLDGSVSGSDLVLEWTTCPSATAYWVYGADNEAYFEPELTSPYMHRQTVIVPPTTTWTSSSGIGDEDHNWVYLVIAVDGSDQEITRSNRAGEHDFLLP